jgi:hypothetical protein
MVKIVFKIVVAYLTVYVSKRQTYAPSSPKETFIVLYARLLARHLQTQLAI